MFLLFSAHDMIGSRHSLRKSKMSATRGWRDARTGRVFGFLSDTQRLNFLTARARFSDGPDRQMPTCHAMTKLGVRCRSPRMRGTRRCFCHSGGAAADRRLLEANLSGVVDRALLAEARRNRNRLRNIWQGDPTTRGSTISLEWADEAACTTWATTQGFELDVLDDDLPAFADSCRWLWARRSRGLIGDSDLNRKVRQLHSRIMEAKRDLDHPR